jgi:two-component system LytT family sensor kinase
MSDIQIVHITLELWGGIFCFMAAACIVFGRGKFYKERRILYKIQIANAILLFSDVVAWVTRGKPGVTAYYMVRISNGLVFLLSYIIYWFFTNYIVSIMEEEGLKVSKIWLYTARAIAAIGTLMVTISQFNNILYGFNSSNLYHRGPLFAVSQLIGLCGMAVNFFYILKNRKKLSRERFIPLVMYIALPAMAMAVQLFVYGYSILNLSITAAVLFTFLISQGVQSRRLIANELQIENLKQEIAISQISPHFTLNCINTIKYLYKTDPKSAEKAIDAFAAFLRNDLNMINQNKKIPFQKELEQIKAYLFLEKKRFGDRVNVEYDLKVLDFEVPPLSVQPLVENAVKHGITKKENGGTIYISTAKIPSGVRIEISDDGIGFDTEAPFSDDRSHIGIQNVTKRLQTMCKASVKIHSCPGEGTTVQIDIPENDQ